MDTIAKLTDLFRQFPGIGPRQAKRFVYFLLSQKNGYTAELSQLLAELKNDIAECQLCHRFFSLDGRHLANQGPSLMCHICANPKRDHSQLMIVSRDVDFENIEKTKAFGGLYFILGGTVPILDDHPTERIRQKELVNSLENRVEKGLKEIIFALDYNPEGEHTRDYMQSVLGPLSIKYGLKISNLGRGLSSGSELEYSDPDTIKNALQSRK